MLTSNTIKHIAIERLNPIDSFRIWMIAKSPIPSSLFPFIMQKIWCRALAVNVSTFNSQLPLLFAFVANFANVLYMVPKMSTVKILILYAPFSILIHFLSIVKLFLLNHRFLLGLLVFGGWIYQYLHMHWFCPISYGDSILSKALPNLQVRQC